MGGITQPRQLLGTDDLSQFDCGRTSLNDWLRRNGWRNQVSGASRTSIVCDLETGQMVGYVTLAATHIKRSALPKAGQRNQPDPIPAVLLGQLAVDVRWHGRGVARSLVFHALRTAVKFSQDIGCFCVLTHPLDEGVREFYRQFGFEDLPGDPMRSLAVRIGAIVAAGLH